MNKQTLTLALLAASIAVICANAVAGERTTPHDTHPPTNIRIEAAGLPPLVLTKCPEQKPLPCGKFHQYKVFGHFSLLTLGETTSANNNTTVSPVTTSYKRKPVKAWNRLSLRTDSRTFPLDIFKSSATPMATTGTLLSPCNARDLAAKTNPAIISIEGNTKNPSGLIILCVDHIPTPPRPTGSLSIGHGVTRDGDKTPLLWKINR